MWIPASITSIMPLPILNLIPHLTPRPWGGTHLPPLYGQKQPEGEPIGEAWSLSDRPEGPSRVSGGPLDGMLFGEVLRLYPVEALGQSQPPAQFPLLIKYIDAAEDLSIQVHPDDAYTQVMHLPDRGKTECWYIMDCQPGAEIIYGLAEGVTREILEQAIVDKQVAGVVRRIPIEPGTFLFVPPGTVHAILGGTLLCEIQQSSNLTYRLWDWNRLPARQLHIQESLDVIRYDPSTQPEPLILSPHPSSGYEDLLLTRNDFFEVRLLRLSPESQCSLRQTSKGFILNGAGGECTADGMPLSCGGTLFIPACIPEVTLQAREQQVTVLLSHSME